MSKRPLMLLALASTLSCSACGSETPPARIPVPAQYLTCADEPVPAEPAGAIDPKTGRRAYTDAQAATYLVDTLAAGDDCRKQVKSIKAWNDTP